MSNQPLLPQSPALQEARPESLQELFSRNPDTFDRRDVEMIVADLRRDRLRRKEAQEAGKKVPRALKATKGVSLMSTISEKGLDEVFGLEP